ncbi:hypothetical protein JCM12294_08940 [Desulfocicer niacini]
MGVMGPTPCMPKMGHLSQLADKWDQAYVIVLLSTAYVKKNNLSKSINNASLAPPRHGPSYDQTSEFFWE